MHTINISVDTFLLLAQDAVYFHTISNLRLVNSKVLKSMQKKKIKKKISKQYNPNLVMVKQSFLTA